MTAINEITTKREEYFYFKEFNISGISHLFFTRNIPGCTHRYIDNELEKKYELTALKNNRAIISSFFQLEEENFCSLRQFHTNKIQIVNAPWPIYKEPVGDGLITTQSNLILAIQTADCVPVLFADPEKKIIAAVHAGWRGARAGIIENTIAKFISLGASPPSLLAAIGPCIHQDNYEVSQDFYDHFLKETDSNERFFRQSQFSYKYYFDLPGYITSKLNKLGVTTINYNLDTYSNPTSFFSYRRSTIEKTSLEGSLISAIVIKDLK
jgi:YfiH family protein